jgi:protein TonB
MPTAPFLLPTRGTAGARSEGRASVRERLIAMLCLTALLHAIVILGLTFTSGIRAGGQDTPQLDVLLVTNEVPEASSNAHAAYLSQRTQTGSGNTGRSQPTGSPVSAGPAWNPSQSATAGDTAKRPQDPDSTRVLVSSAPSPEIRYFEAAPAGGAQPASDLPEIIGDADGPPRAGRGDAMELLLRGTPDAQHWVAPDTQASKLAPYLAGWKRKVERVGTLHFPSIARNAGLSGSPVIEVEIGADGRLTGATVRRSSGYDALDEAALTILKLASPFDPFPVDLAAEYAQLRFAYQWEFVAGTVQTGAVTASSDMAAGP